MKDANVVVELSMIFFSGSVEVGSWETSNFLGKYT